MMGVWRNGSASDFDCHSLSEGCSFEYCHAHSFCRFPFPCLRRCLLRSSLVHHKHRPYQGYFHKPLGIRFLTLRLSRRCHCADQRGRIATHWVFYRSRVTFSPPDSRFKFQSQLPLHYCASNRESDEKFLMDSNRSSVLKLRRPYRWSLPGLERSVEDCLRYRLGYGCGCGGSRTV